MSFGFDASQYAVDPATLPAVAPPQGATPTAQGAAASTQAAPQAPGQPYQPGFLDILQGMMFDHQSPAEAAMAARQRNYQSKTMAIMADVLQNASPDQQKAMLLNPSELGKAVASRFQSMALKPGETRDNGEGGLPGMTAPVMGFDPVSGRGYTQLPGSTTPTGPSLGGGIKAENGVILSDRLGPMGSYSAPQVIPPGSTGASFLPQISMSGAPKAAPATSAPVSATPSASSLLTSQGQLDPSAFFKSFVLPHEGGWNARDLNGSPTKYGINASSNPGVDVSKITPDDAAGIFASKYFPSSASLPPALAAVNADTAFINPTKAAAFLAQSGGDPSKYMDLRDQWMAGMVARNPAAQKYAQAWANRNADLRQVAAQLGGAQSDTGGHSAPTAATAGFGAPFAQGKTPAPMTVADRAKWGISPSDPSSYALGPDGRPFKSAEAFFGPSQQLAYTAQVTGTEPYKNYSLGRGYLATMGTLMKQPGGFADLGLIENAGKTVNPTVAIRPNMIEQYSKEVGWTVWLQGEVSSVVNHGGHLTQQGRNALLNIAQANVQSHWEQLQPILKKVDHDAARYGATREDLIPDLVPMPGTPGASYPGAHIPGKPQPAATSSAPTIGQVVNGRPFRGGDPTDPRSWGPRQ